MELPLNKYLIGLCAMLLVAVGLMAYDAGRKSVAIKDGEAVAKNWKERGKIDGETTRMDGYDVCISLGGAIEECAALKGQ